MADDRDPVEHTTIIETGNSGGNGGIIAVVVLLLVVLALLFLFRTQLGLGGKSTAITVPDKIDVHVNSN